MGTGPETFKYPRILRILDRMNSLDHARKPIQESKETITKRDTYYL